MSKEPHVLPHWATWVQDNILLSALLIAEAYILGDLMTLGWVKNIEDPASWGWFNFIGIVAFFAAGAAASGIALRSSVAANQAFRDGHPFRGLFNMTGLLVFSIVEVYASLSERSAHLAPTPADSSVMAMLGLSGIAVSPTVVMVALLLPFATFYWGFSQIKVTEETAEEAKARYAAKLERAHYFSELAAVGAAGARRAGRALTGRDEQQAVPDVVPVIDESDDEQDDASAQPGEVTIPQLAYRLSLGGFKPSGSKTPISRKYGAKTVRNWLIKGTEYPLWFATHQRTVSGRPVRFAYERDLLVHPELGTAYQRGRAIVDEREARKDARNAPAPLAAVA